MLSWPWVRNSESLPNCAAFHARRMANVIQGNRWQTWAVLQVGENWRAWALPTVFLLELKGRKYLEAHEDLCLDFVYSLWTWCSHLARYRNGVPSERDIVGNSELWETFRRWESRWEIDTKIPLEVMRPRGFSGGCNVNIHVGYTNCQIVVVSVMAFSGKHTLFISMRFRNSAIWGSQVIRLAWKAAQLGRLSEFLTQGQLSILTLTGVSSFHLVSSQTNSVYSLTTYFYFTWALHTLAREPASHPRKYRLWLWRHLTHYHQVPIKILQEDGD